MTFRLQKREEPRLRARRAAIERIRTELPPAGGVSVGHDTNVRDPTAATLNMVGSRPVPALRFGPAEPMTGL